MFSKLRAKRWGRKEFMGANQLRSEIERLAAFILDEFHDEIGKGVPSGGSESAVDVSIRLLKRYRDLTQDQQEEDNPNE